MKKGSKKNNLNKLINERVIYCGKKEAKWRSLQDELLKALVINKCWQRINDLLDDPKAEKKFLNLLASEIAKITISQDIKEKGSFH
jgi:hypothetical protein